MKTRVVQRVIPSVPASDGAGVKLRRSLGSGQFARVCGDAVRRVTAPGEVDLDIAPFAPAQIL